MAIEIDWTKGPRVQLPAFLPESKRKKSPGKKTPGKLAPLEKYNPDLGGYVPAPEAAGSPASKVGVERDYPMPPMPKTPAQEEQEEIDKIYERMETREKEHAEWLKKQGKRQQQAKKRIPGQGRRKREQERKTLLGRYGEGVQPGLRETILTGPVGILGDTPARRKTLLGI
jgi:hypothetical protein